MSDDAEKVIVARVNNAVLDASRAFTNSCACESEMLMAGAVLSAKLLNYTGMSLDDYAGMIAEALATLRPAPPAH